MAVKKTKFIETTPLKRFAWKPDQVLAFRTMHNIWVLGQTVDIFAVAFFNVFAKGRKFTAESWEKSSLLHVTAVTNQFMKGSAIHKIGLKPKRGISYPTKWINSELFPQYRKVVLWKGTRHERRLRVQYSGTLVSDGEDDADFWPTKDDILIKQIRLSDGKTIDNHELAGSAVTPYSNHRLYLCYKLKRNADPIKELCFRRPLPLEYKPLIDKLYPKDHF